MINLDWYAYPVYYICLGIFSWYGAIKPRMESEIAQVREDKDDIEENFDADLLEHFKPRLAIFYVLTWPYFLPVTIINNWHDKIQIVKILAGTARKLSGNKQLVLQLVKLILKLLRNDLLALVAIILCSIMLLRRC